MHDIDRALFESEDESEFEFELPAEAESHGFLAGEADEAGVAGESYEMAMAHELLGVSSEAELDRFLGNLLGKAVSGVRGFARSDAGRAIGGILKSAAKQALPGLGQAAGGALGRRAGQWLGGRLELGLETEGLSHEDREFETARAFVRFAQDSAQRTAQAAATKPPAAAAQQAAVAAAQRHLPGLLRQAAPNPNGNGSGRATQGRWVRRGNRIVILGA